MKIDLDTNKVVRFYTFAPDIARPGSYVDDVRFHGRSADLATDAIRRRAPDGTITIVVQDVRLHWVDAPFLDGAHRLWLPVPQMDRSPNFSGADRPRAWPVRLYRIDLPH